MELSWTLLLSATGLLLFGYFYHVNRAMSVLPEEAEKIASKPWTKEEILAAYEKCRQERPDFKKDLPPKQNRRYVVFGGSGLVGGWLVEHLIMRGENASAIRIADLQAPRRDQAVKQRVPYFKADVTDAASVSKVFTTPWPAEHAQLPLTVFHTVAYIHAGYRKVDFLDTYMKVNVEGTENVLNAAKAAGCDVFIATSSCSTAIRPLDFFIYPWEKHPRNFVQLSENGEPPPLKLENFAGCYAYTKALAEKLVRDADSKRDSFRTGAIRPGHTIYGHGDQNKNSVVYDYLRRGGLQTWLTPFVLQYVSAQNVSLAHLLYEARLLAGHDIGGNAYAVCDPGPPFRYSDLYRAMSTLAHPSTPIRWPEVQPLPLLLIAHLIEGYMLLRRRYLSFLPEITNFDLSMLQPAVFNYSTLVIIYDDSRARRELGYNTSHDTLEGVCLHMLEWNEQAEARLKAKGEAEEVVVVATVPEKSVPGVAQRLAA
ncbi:hypothetical protein AYO21_10101 [Fonsecaea monophora]|uniref:3-beta hydroxysteroid dehydrogenase/isomerase domain-containing protein n=1 Tax=Fonsecaea monophora TaxID=254056 RepID=A0A177EUM7_9EURO|nr:hypothetical protein AYO21_10101 [Fonsecaea monophora]KAH0846118.1 3-beta hydroxysteroid dehydrogenase/isomerase family protein [Fonsecaea pedrosoi]OAG35707.1 hypothetical protein AYO21_10101 [Fonsecaea monophora]